MREKRSVTGLDEILRQRFSRRSVLTTAALAPFAFSEGNKLADKLRENGVRSDLADLLVTKESLENNNIYPYATADAVDASGTVIRQYVVNGQGLFSSYWDEQKRRYTEYTWPKKLLPEFSTTNLIALPDDKTVIVAGAGYDSNAQEYEMNLHISNNRGESFDEHIPVVGPEAAIIDGKLIPGTDKALFQADVSGLGTEYVLFDIPSRDYKVLQANTVEDEEGNTVLSLLPDLDTISVNPDKTKAIVDGVLYGYDPFPQYHQDALSVFAVGQAHIDLKSGSLERISYSSPSLKEPQTVTFERNEQGELSKMYEMSSFPERKMHIVDAPSGKIDIIPFEPFDEYLKQKYGKGEWEAMFIRLARIRDTYVATGTSLLREEIEGNPYMFYKALTAFWPVGVDPSLHKDLVSLRVIDTDPKKVMDTTVVNAREKLLHGGGKILEEIIPGFGIAAISLDDGQPLGEEILFPDKGLQE